MVLEGVGRLHEEPHLVAPLGRAGSGCSRRAEPPRAHHRGREVDEPADRTGETAVLSASCSAYGHGQSPRLTDYPAAAGTPAMSTIQATPNRSLHMPKWSPHGAFSSGIITVPPAERPSQ
jgi:hypothetical protein